MSRKRITFACAAALALLLVGCGGGGGGVGTSTTESDKAADAQILNYALARELTAIDAYTRALPLLRGQALATGREFRAQEQEHVDAITKAIRGLGGKTATATATDTDTPTDTDSPPCGGTRRSLHRGPTRCTAAIGRGSATTSSFDAPVPKTQADALAFLYGVENSLVRSHTGEIAKLIAPWPRSLLTSIVANEAQQLVLLRGALGAPPRATVPEAFEAGTTPPPGEVQPAR